VLLDVEAVPLAGVTEAQEESILNSSICKKGVSLFESCLRINKLILDAALVVSVVFIVAVGAVSPKVEGSGLIQTLV